MRTACEVFGGRKKRADEEPRGSARPQHYIFAHEALRGVCRDDPLRFFTLMSSSSQRELVEGLWAFVGKHLGPQASPELDPGEIAVQTSRVRGFPMILVRMPPPVAIAEAYFVALVLLVDQETLARKDAPTSEVTVRYFTLERALSEDREARTLLCEWTELGHLSYGDGPEPNALAFVGAVEERLWALLS